MSNEAERTISEQFDALWERLRKLAEQVSALEARLNGLDKEHYSERP